MRKWIRGAELADSMASHIERIVWWGPHFLFGGASATGMALLARATAWLNEWGPIAWGLAALVGALGGVSLVWLAQLALLAAARLSYYKAHSGIPDGLNPLERTFHNKRIRIADIAPPFGEPIRGKVFTSCELVGPANIVAMGYSSLVKCTFKACDFVHVLPNRACRNVIVLDDVSFKDCTFYFVTVYVPESNIDWMEKGMPNIEWVNR